MTSLARVAMHTLEPHVMTSLTSVILIFARMAAPAV